MCGVHTQLTLIFMSIYPCVGIVVAFIRLCQRWHNVLIVPRPPLLLRPRTLAQLSLVFCINYTNRSRSAPVEQSLKSRRVPNKWTPRDIVVGPQSAIVAWLKSRQSLEKVREWGRARDRSRGWLKWAHSCNCRLSSISFDIPNLEIVWFLRHNFDNASAPPSHCLSSLSLSVVLIILIIRFV